MYRSVFWDLGGTLVDTYPALDQALADVVAKHGGTVDLAEVAKLTRVSTSGAIEELSDRYAIDEAEFHAANDELKALWETRPAPAMAGAADLLRDLSAAGGLNLVVTHRDRDSAASLLEGLGLRVDDLVSTADGFPRKPDPAMYVELLRRHSRLGQRPVRVRTSQR